MIMYHDVMRKTITRLALCAALFTPNDSHAITAKPNPSVPAASFAFNFVLCSALAYFGLRSLNFLWERDRKGGKKMSRKEQKQRKQTATNTFTAIQALSIIVLAVNAVTFCMFPDPFIIIGMAIPATFGVAASQAKESTKTDTPIDQTSFFLLNFFSVFSALNAVTSLLMLFFGPAFFLPPETLQLMSSSSF